MDKLRAGSVLLSVALFGLMAAPAWSAPYIPRADNVVIETLPARPAFKAVTTPTDPREALDAALEDTRALMLQARAEGDPRYLGYAEARLAPWLKPADPIMPVRLLRARLRQASHRFDEALVDIRVVLQREPTQPEALLLQASIAQVRGDYATARHACQGLGGLGTLAIGLSCLAQVDSLNGQAGPALQRLQAIAGIDQGMSREQQVWMNLATADLAARLQDDALAEHYYRLSLGGGPDALGSYADWLLEHQRPAEVLPLLQPWTRHDGLLLRLCRAELALHQPQGLSHARALADRINAARLRGDFTHQREEAMFAYYIQNSPAEALRLARSNWRQQREPADLRIYVLAAHAQHSEADLSALRQWLQQTRLEDRRLTPWLGAQVAQAGR